MDFPLTLPEILEQRTRRNADKVFLRFADETLTYEDFDRKTNQAANALVNMGVKKGDRVCLMLGNRPEFLYLWFGLAKIGGVLVPVNTAFKGQEAAYVINHSEAAAVFTESSFAEVLAGIRSDCPSVRQWLGLDTAADGRFHAYPDLLAEAGEDAPGVKISETDLLSIIYTSGTTGRPKGAMHSHRTYVLAGWAFTRRMDLNSTDTVLAFMPLFHINAQIYSAMGTLLAEATLALLPRFSLSRFWDDARRHKATKFNCPVAAGYLLAKRPPSDRDRDHSLKMVFIGPLREDLAEAFEERFGILPIDGYGMTECPNICQNPHDGVRKVGSMGTPAVFPDPSIPLTEMKLVDDDDREVPVGTVPVGTVGEVAVRSPLLTLGYYKDPDRTAEAMKGGWFHTGDNAYRDEDGYYYFVDRKKDVIRRRGENISSAEVEFVLFSHPDVTDAAVIPVPSELGEDEVKACIVPTEGADLKPASIVEWCEARLAKFKVPRYIEFRESLPKTPTQKVEKYVLRREKTDLTEGCWDRERAKG